MGTHNLFFEQNIKISNFSDGFFSAEKYLCIAWASFRNVYFRDDSSSLGPFLVIYDELDRLTKTNKIGIYEAVWRYKLVFPNMIPDFVSCCYCCLCC